MKEEKISEVSIHILQLTLTALSKYIEIVAESSSCDPAFSAALSWMKSDFFLSIFKLRVFIATQVVKLPGGELFEKTIILNVLNCAE